MQMVKILALKPRMSAHETVLELYIDTAIDSVVGGALNPYGAKLLKSMETESIEVDGTSLSFADKEIYLNNLHRHLNTSYLTATQYINQPSDLPATE